MKRAKRVVLVGLVLALLASLFIIGRQVYDGWRNRRDSEEAARLVGLTEDGPREPAAPEDGEDAPEEDMLWDEE